MRRIAAADRSAGRDGAEHAINSTAERRKKFEYTGAEQSFKVPVGVTAIEVDALGAAGAGHQKGYLGIPGHGGRVKATIPVKPGQTLRIFVGGSGSYPSRGFNGGGDGAYRGGGATDVRDGNELSDRILVAGGGGGVGLNTRKRRLGWGRRRRQERRQWARQRLLNGFGSPGQGGTQSKGGAGGASGQKSRRRQLGSIGSGW